MLTKRQLDSFKRNLNEMKERTSTKSIYESSDLSFRSLAGEVHDTGDESVANETVDVNTSIANLRKQELDNIDTALQRIDENIYGICIECGAEIEVNRLLAIPVAKRCFDCKDRFERLI